MWFCAPLLALFLLQSTDYSADGRKALEARKYDEAAQLFAKAVEADPKDFTAHFHLALSYSLLNKDVEAIAEYGKVLELKPGLYEAELNTGVLLLRQKRAVDAIPYLEKALEAKPKEYRPHYYAGEALLAAGQPAKAEEQYRTAAELDPKSAAAELGLGRAQSRQNRLGEGAVHFRKAAELDPAFRDALLELADLYEKNHQPAEAIAIYEQFPANMAAQERMGELLVETKKYADAIPRLEKTYQQDPSTANTLALAQAYLFNKQLDKAVPLFEKSVAAEPANYDLRMMYGRALRDQKQYKPAALQFYEALKLKPESLQTWNDLGGMLYLMESYTQALAAFDRARKLGDTSPANDYFRAIILDKMREYPVALESYQKFLANSEGKYPDEEFKARQRVRIIQNELKKR